MTIAGKILIFIDKLGNMLAGGNIDNTISARVGYFAIRTQPNPFWEMLQGVINFAFWPIDGPQHCYDSYVKESKRDNTPDFKKGNKAALVLLSTLVITSCSVISPVVWVLSKLKKGR